MATHSSVLAWRIPGTGESGGLPSMGSHQQHGWHREREAGGIHVYLQFSIKITGRFFSPDYSSTLANVKKKSELGSVGGIGSAERICALPKPYFITFQN